MLFFCLVNLYFNYKVIIRCGFTSFLVISRGWMTKKLSEIPFSFLLVNKLTCK